MALIPKKNIKIFVVFGNSVVTDLVNPNVEFVLVVFRYCIMGSMLRGDLRLVLFLLLNEKEKN